MVTLQEMLLARDLRVGTQAFLRREYGYPLVACTMNIPGPMKNNLVIQRCFDIGVGNLSCIFKQQLDLILEHRLETGPECYFIVISPIDLRELKRELVRFEETFPIGRWFDLDVKDPEGKSVSRRDVGMEERSCFLCGRPAKECGRSRRHSVDELYSYTEHALVAFLSEAKRCT